MGPRTWPSWLGAAGLSLVCALPAGVRNALAERLARAYLRRPSKHRQIASVNLEACFPDMDDTARQALLERYLARLIQTVLQSPRLWWGAEEDIRRRVRWHGREHLESARAADRPVILLISHTVALDVGMIALSPDFPMHGIYKPFPNPVVDWLTQRARTRFGGQPVARGGGFRGMLRGLQRGSLLCYLSDEDLGRDGSVFAPFFGCTKATLAMLPRLVRKSGAVVLPMATMYDPADDRFDAHVLAPLALPLDADEVANATCMNEAIESTVRLAPEQYLWKMRLFATCPAGGSGRYRRLERGELSPRDL